MRTIKFRAWDRRGKKWICIWQLNLNCDGEIRSLDDLDGKRYNIAEIKLMQFTGLKDKNGKEIYEGDILNKPHPYDIVFLQGGFHLHAFTNKGKEHWYPISNWLDEENENRLRNLEIIDNIYENKDLLKEEER